MAATLVSGVAAAQLPNARERARAPYDEGLAHMRNEAFDKAAKSFDQAIAIDSAFEMAYYMLGRVHLVQRNYASAVAALRKARDLFQADATSAATNKQERQSVIRERLADIEQLIVDTRAAAAETRNATRQAFLLEQVRQYEERRRQLRDLDRNDVMTATQAVPGFVSLSLGSAYFRAGKLQEAEQAYLAALAADSKIGEAHSNLAVLYMQTGRLEEAEKAVKAAEKTGLRVNPALKDEIKRRKKLPDALSVASQKAIHFPERTVESNRPHHLRNDFRNRLDLKIVPLSFGERRESHERLARIQGLPIQRSMKAKPPLLMMVSSGRLTADDGPTDIP